MKRLCFVALVCGVGAYTYHATFGNDVVPANTSSQPSWNAKNMNSQPGGHVSAQPAPPSVLAASVVLMNADSGQVLYASQADEERAPASTTKLMSMLLIMEVVQRGSMSWNDIVPVTPNVMAIAQDPHLSDANLRPTDQFTLGEMMRYIAVLSANDATVAVADKISGSLQGFVDQMNAEANRLGLQHTHFMNPDGLPANNHYMSAIDLAKLARYLIRTYPDVLDFTALPSVTIHGAVRPSTDDLLGHYPGLDGLKTGYTQKAGYCFVGTAKRAGKRLIVVVMGDTSTNQNRRFTDAASLLDYGFRQLGVA